MIGAGAFVRFGGELGDVYEGFCPSRRIRGEHFDLNETETALVGRRSGGAIRLGDPVACGWIGWRPLRGRCGAAVAARPARRHSEAPRRRVRGPGPPERWPRGSRSPSPATSPPTGAPATNSSCSTASRRDRAVGTEVKALREGKAQLGDAYAVLDRGEVWLRNAHIPPYAPAAAQNHDPERPRKLLLHRYEIERLAGEVERRGLTLIPTRIYFKGPYAKVELALARRRSSGTGAVRSAIATFSVRSSGSIANAFGEPPRP